MRSYDRYPTRYPLTAYFWPGMVLLILAAILVWRVWSPWSNRPHGIDPAAVPRVVTPRGDLAEDERSTIALFKQVSPSVVHITTLAVRQDSFTLDLWQIPQGTGSGFLWDQDGHIVTNYHVVQGANAAQVTLADHSTWQAGLVGAYPDKDLAVLIIDAPRDRLPPIALGTASDLQVGQKVFAIGNPFGLDQSLTTGVISALGREIESVTRRAIKDMIQTDAAINPGNSGGPLLDSAGRLIGVNTAIFSPSGAYAGIGFAIPADEVNRIVPQLIRHGKITRPGLGIQVAPDQFEHALGVTGVLIMGVQPGGPAAKAGLRPTRRDDTGRLQLGDVIVAVNAAPVQTVDDLLDALEKSHLGTPVQVTVLRDNQQQTVTVVPQAIQ
jgi:S1-C subfamily serine protease